MHRILPCHASYHDHAGSLAFSYNCCIGCLYSVRFFADSTDELMRATTSSSAVFIAKCFPGEHSLLCYLFYSFASIYIASLCCDALVVSFLLLLPGSRYIAYLPPPTAMFVCVSCLSLASRSACLGLLFDVVGRYHVTPSTY